MRRWVATVAAALALGCSGPDDELYAAPGAGGAGGSAGSDAGAGGSAATGSGGMGNSGGTNAGGASSGGSTAGGSGGIGAGGSDAGGPAGALADHRDRLLATLGEPCATWNGFDESQRAVFLTLTHRLYLSRTADGLPMLAHITRVYLVLGGGANGTDCGGGENNRLFLQMDSYLWGQMVATWDGARVISDSGAFWGHTKDIAGPHDPFDASNETEVGLSCTLLFENGDSKPPTAQAHFFLQGSETPVERGSGISLPADPYMLEIDHDFDCWHQSNPTCSDFEDRYRNNYGDFECEWVPAACTPVGTGCYRGAG